MTQHQFNWQAPDRPTQGHRCNWTYNAEPSEENSVAPDRPTVHKRTSVQSTYHYSESMSRGQKRSLKH